ncbi:hypothetical protein OV079_05770 [Nannocystis pusilla]|uniref:Uncharacterized protein n=1 Tax=Nannocystis pusilla TaxID=889268 RepID=A0A9X3EK05_9BACT|nr:hypothetical protein [Nannocystis pusilla]MCY1005086.1 hypothetical protein [Nannocystis pusilla]
MYGSLKTAHGSFRAEDGETCFVQTDERPASEIAQDLDYSTLFALVRTLNPLRMKPEGRPRLHYVFAEVPPDPVQEAVASAGGYLIHKSSLIPHDGLRAPEDIADLALSRIAQRVAAERNLEFTGDHLLQLETELARPPLTDDPAYWRAVFDLGAFAGEALRKVAGGRWIRCDQAGVVPFAFASRFRSEPAQLYVLAKAMKFFANGPEDSLTGFVDLAAPPSPKTSLWSRIFG